MQLLSNSLLLVTEILIKLLRQILIFFSSAELLSSSEERAALTIFICLSLEVFLVICQINLLTVLTIMSVGGISDQEKEVDTSIHEACQQVSNIVSCNCVHNTAVRCGKRSNRK